MDFEKFAVLSMNNLAQVPKSHCVGFYTLWFDVEKGRLTTEARESPARRQLWFDVVSKIFAKFRL